MLTNPNAAQIAQQFQTEDLEPRKDMWVPYGHDIENEDPDPTAGSCEDC